jgi:hypothetical protein
MRIGIPFSSFNRGDNLQYWVVFWMGVWVMWMRLVRVLAVLAATYQATIGQAATSQAATAKNIGSIHVGSWAGGVFTEKTGEFGFCAATTAVEGDYLLTVGQNGGSVLGAGHHAFELGSQAQSEALARADIRWANANQF